jgi:PTH1 family peptidyl-tRNA hydrolase
MKLIAGLGNPGREYAGTRHNVGFMVIDRLAKIMGVAVGKKMFKALTGQGQVNGEKVILIKPQTYMNLSGEAVNALLNWYKLSAADLIVIYDDLDLPAGKLRLRPGGGSGGHKGMLSIIRSLGTENFPRIRIGIGRPAGACIDSVDYVLGRIGSGEAEEMEEALKLAAEAALCVVRESLEQAMNRYNRR